MVLAGCQRQHMFTVADDDETGFLALQKFLDDHAGLPLASRCRRAVAAQHEINRSMRLLQGFGHDHALASGQTIGLDHNRRTLRVHIGMRIGRIAECGKRGSRNRMALHKGFRKSFGAL